MATLPQAVATFSVVSRSKIAANTASPSTPFDLIISPHQLLNKLTTTADTAVLKVIDKDSKLYKDTIYGFTRSSTTSTTLVDCKRLIGAEITQRDIIVSSFGDYEMGIIEGYLSTSLTANESIYYVGKHGLDTNDGLTWQTAFLTWAKATATLTPMTRDIDNKYAVVCFDAGVYAENIGVLSYCFYYAPNADLRGNNTISDFSLLNCERGTPAGILSTDIWCIKTVGADNGGVFVKRVICKGASSAVASSSGGIEIDFVRMDIENGYGLGDASTTGGIVTATGRVIEKSGASNAAIAAANASSELSLNIDYVNCTGGAIGVQTIGAGSKINGEVVHLSTSGDAVQGSTGSEINLSNSEYTGTINTNSGDVRINSAKNGVMPRFVDDTDYTKVSELDLSGITTGTTRTITIPDRDTTLGSTDGTLAGNSDAKIPTEKAVKTYVDSAAPSTGVTTKNATGALTINEVYGSVILCDTSAASFTLTLPAVGATEDGLRAKIKCKGANPVIIAGNGADTIEDIATLTLFNGNSASIVYDHTNTDWMII